jgi:hypothetical protein
MKDTTKKIIIGIFVSIILGCFLFLGICTLYGVILKISNKPIEKEITAQNTEYLYLSREEISKKIKELYYTNSELALSLYDTYTHDRKITIIIFSAWVLTDIPIDLLFSVASVESGYNPNIISKPNPGGSVDIGLFQINNHSHPQYSIDYIKEPSNNTRIAVEKIKDLYDQYGSYEEAIIGYNCGAVNNAPARTIHYMSIVLEVERNIDKEISLKLQEVSHE